MSRLVSAIYSAFEDLPIGVTAVGLTSAKISTRSTAFITVEKAPVRFSLHGTAPTASAGGHLVEIDGVIILPSFQTMEAALFIRDASATQDAVLRCSYGTDP